MLCSCIETSKVVMMSVLSKVICRFNTVPIKKQDFSYKHKQADSNLHGRANELKYLKQFRKKEKQNHIT